MTDVIKIGKRAFTWSVVFTTIMWSVGAAALIPLVANAETCPTLAAGELFKVSGVSAVYLLNADMERMYFPSSELYHTWYEDFSGVTEIANTCVDAYPAPSSAPYGVNYRPGSRLVKVQISNSVYALGPNNTKLLIDSPEVATALYGANWATLVRDTSDAYWPNIVTTGATISTNVPHDGMLIKAEDSNDVFHVVDGMKYLVVGDVLNTSEVRTVATAVFDAVETGTGTVT
ncbi:hypothetical protein KJ641_04570, partial [Patescibacteria group bacterium]|nr:hypothetical protein [Patescibacteria group bacterium]